MSKYEIIDKISLKKKDDKNNLFTDEIIFNDRQCDFFNKIFVKKRDKIVLDDNNFWWFAYFGGVGSGKSFVCQLTAWLLAIIYPNLEILYTRDQWRELKDSVIKQMNNDFYKYGYYVHTKEKQAENFNFVNGSVINFRSYDNPSKILSTSFDAIFVCQAENLDYLVYSHFLDRLRGKNIKKNIMVFEGNPSGSYIKEKIHDLKEEERIRKGIYFLSGETSDNKENLPPNYIQRLEDNHGKDWINRYVHGNWKKLSNRVFSEFDEDHHIIPYRDILNMKTDDFIEKIGLDYGWLHDTALIWAYVDYDGRIIVYDEWGGKMKFIDEISLEAKRYGNKTVIADYAIKGMYRDGKSIWYDLINSGLTLKNCNKQQTRNVERINALFKNDQILISDTCQKTIDQIKRLKWKVPKYDTLAEEQILDKDKDYTDAFMYVVIELDGKRTLTNYEKFYHNTLEYHTHKRTPKYIVY